MADAPDRNQLSWWWASQAPSQPASAIPRVNPVVVQAVCDLLTGCVDDHHVVLVLPFADDLQAGVFDPKLTVVGVLDDVDDGHQRTSIVKSARLMLSISLQSSINTAATQHTAAKVPHPVSPPFP
jgi:hypothetical protein